MKTYTKLPEKFSIFTPTQELSNVIQQRLYLHGYKWCDGESGSPFDNVDGDEPGKWIDAEYTGELELSYDTNSNTDTILTVEELFSIPLPEEKPKVINILPWEVSLEQEDFVEIGCQEIDRSDFDDLLRNIQTYREGLQTGGLTKDWYIEVADDALAKVVYDRLIGLGWSCLQSHPGNGQFYCYNQTSKTFGHVAALSLKGDRRQQLTIAELFGGAENELELGDYSFTLKENGFEADDEFVTWETFDKFLAAL